jgi:hypothetical protein
MLGGVFHSLESSLHAGDGGKISQYLTGSANDHLLGELLIVVEVGEQGEERVVVEDADVVGFILIEDVAQVHLQQTLDEAAEDAVQSLASLN